jgi:RNA polymerase sigma factor (sigma-70 family)
MRISNAPVHFPARGSNLVSLATEGQSDRQLLEHFRRRRDEAAFEALVGRHGPMVLGVCRRVLGNEADAEDAFQATFLVLARKAGSVARPELLAGWLFGVACRVARKARAQLARRRRLEAEGGLAPMLPQDPLQEAAMEELRSLLDEELRRLPMKYQAPLVLCYLEGLTNEEAAQQLGWPTGSMSYRLARGREMLRERLRRRNRSVPPVLMSSLLAGGPAKAALSPNLLQGTVQAAVAEAAGKIGLASPAVTALVDKAVKSLTIATRRWRLFVIALLLALAAGASTLAYSAATGELPFGLKSSASRAPSSATTSTNSSSCH